MRVGPHLGVGEQIVICLEDTPEYDTYGSLCRGDMVFYLYSQDFNAHGDSGTFMITWARVLSSLGIGWVWKRYLEELK